ncbi:hypothetical protein J28TS4_51070 [Paenibacillus lautus]|nr:hypothetical protein J28TS4_51070 [Paenibacillus lautus]
MGLGWHPMPVYDLPPSIDDRKLDFRPPNINADGVTHNKVTLPSVILKKRTKDHPAFADDEYVNRFKESIH